MRDRLPAPRPDFTRLRQVFFRQGEPDRLPLIEHSSDHEIKEAFLGERMAPYPAMGSCEFTHEIRARYLEFATRFWYEAGYDYLTIVPDIPLPLHRIALEDTAPLRRDRRQWADEHAGPITSWEDFERYPWPKPEDVDYFGIEWAGKHLPEGMKLIVLGPGGQFENLSWLMGVSTLAIALFDAPDLVRAIAERIGSLLESLFATVADMPNVGALWFSDDLGFKTSTMISPKHLRTYVFPYQKRVGEIAHAHDLPYLLHSCGNLTAIMDELIDVVGIDAKHSFEDVITPVTEAKRLWGDRIAILGGIDMDYLCRHSVEEVRAYTRRVIEACAPGGGYALGTGNTVANYVPIQNYLAMLEEGARYGS